MTSLHGVHAFAYHHVLCRYNNCLKDRPNIYDENEWRKFLELLPGQKYSYDIQCQNVYGEGAYFCGVSSISYSTHTEEIS